MARPIYKIFAVLSKKYTDEKYSHISKIDKAINIKEVVFSEEIENLIARDKL